MTSTFSSNDTECLSRDTEHDMEINSLDQIWDKQRLDECISWINEKQFEKVCLQFPDDLITYSVTILDDLKKNSNATFCILGDTSYGSCCVDEVAASHVTADAMIHFGHACISKVSRLPVHYVFPNFELNVSSLVEQILESIPSEKETITIFYSTCFFYQRDKLKSAVAPHKNISVAHLAIDSKPDVLCWTVSNKNLDGTTCIWIGNENQSFFNLCISIRAKEWYTYSANIDNLQLIINPLATNWLRRRNYFVEKCKDALTIGIVVGTLTANGYLDTVCRIQTLARDRGIRTYLFSVGKINPAKLANFIDIDCFVFVGCPENNIFTSREFYKPIVSVFEAELALNPAWREKYPDFYAVNFIDILPDGKYYCDDDGIYGESNGNNDYDVSLVTGRVRSMKTTTDDDKDKMNETNPNTQIERKNNQLMQTNSSIAFNERSWTGLNPNLGQEEPAKITKGRSGIAIKYTENEH